jgi:hypothetical protein
MTAIPRACEKNLAGGLFPHFTEITIDPADKKKLNAVIVFKGDQWAKILLRAASGTVYSINSRILMATTMMIDNPAKLLTLLFKIILKSLLYYPEKVIFTKYLGQ